MFAITNMDNMRIIFRRTEANSTTMVLVLVRVTLNKDDTSDSEFAH